MDAKVRACLKNNSQKGYILKRITVITLFLGFLYFLGEFCFSCEILILSLFQSHQLTNDRGCAIEKYDFFFLNLP